MVQWLNRHYLAVIAEALNEVGRPGTPVQFVPVEGAPADVLAPIELMEPAPDVAPAGQDPASGPEHVGLSPRYSFDTFIVGASNQFAHAACRAVAEAPSDRKSTRLNSSHT